jgi:hypothetical protein
VTGRGEPGYIDPDLDDELLGAGRPGAGVLIKLGHLGRERGDRLLDPH